MHIKIKLWLFMLLAGFITIIAFSGLALAAEFSADVILKGGSISRGMGKVWVKDQKMRQEFSGQTGKMITIMDLDQGFQWVLMPESKTYMKTKIETKGKSFRPENFIAMQKGPMEAQVKVVGTETVNGYNCDKYLITFQNKQMGTMTQWFAKKLNYPIKMIHKSAMLGEVVTELDNIKKGGVKDALFKIPSVYKEMQIPQMPKMPLGKQQDS
jgi:outer membrane lipoprotein-sorting protein